FQLSKKLTSKRIGFQLSKVTNTNVQEISPSKLTRQMHRISTFKKAY
ncbi:13569_t:CDS:2, partial [Entrophospora sp. SA101]